MSSVLRNLFTKHLFATNVIATGGLLALGDGITQNMEIKFNNKLTEDGKENKQVYDWSRTGRMFTIGLLFGPFNHFWYTKFIEMVVGPKSTGTRGALKRILADQLVAGPLFVSGFLFGMSAMEGKGIEGAKQEVKDKFLTLYMIDWCVWPPSQFINFYFLPKQLRVMYVGVITLCWDTFLSWYKHKDQAHKTASKLKDSNSSH